MNTFSKIKNSLGEALNDFGEALTAALAWLEEGDSSNHELAAGYKRSSPLRPTKLAVPVAPKSQLA